MWVPLLEKAWGKLKGNYFQSEYGNPVSAIHSLTGLPVFFFGNLKQVSETDIYNLV